MLKSKTATRSIWAASRESDCVTFTAKKCTCGRGAVQGECSKQPRWQRAIGNEVDKRQQARVGRRRELEIGTLTPMARRKRVRKRPGFGRRGPSGGGYQYSAADQNAERQHNLHLLVPLQSGVHLPRYVSIWQCALSFACIATLSTKNSPYPTLQSERKGWEG